MFGLFMLIGIVKKNGILQVDKTNELRAAGMPRDEAILEANHTRLRPILMTTAMLIAAMIPIALGQGPGASAPSQHGQSNHRWPGAVTIDQPAGHPRRLLSAGRFTQQGLGTKQRSVCSVTPTTYNAR